MKKVLALLLAVLLVVPMLISCKESETTSKTTDVQEQPSEKEETPKKSPSKEEKPKTTKEILEGKTALFTGDSLSAASVHDKEHPRFGWAKRIELQYGLSKMVNTGRDGASVSNCRGENTIISQIERMKNQKFDFIILEGSTNDAWDSIEVGKITEEGTENFDLTTFAGGLEDLLSKTKKYFPDSYIGYMFNYQLRTSRGRMGDMTEYLEEAKKICEKWDVPMLNLYEDAKFNKELNIKRNSPDGIHPKSKGYDILAPKIADFMASLPELYKAV